MSVKQSVIDTNVLVSAGINLSGAPGRVLISVERLELQAVISAEVMAEYRDVLTRLRFRFQPEWIDRLFDNLEVLGLLLEPAPIDSALLPDAPHAPFIALARYAGCPVITGNTKHFPAEAGIVVLTPAGWVAELASG